HPPRPGAPPPGAAPPGPPDCTIDYSGCPCGNGVKDASEECDPLASPTGCPEGKTCGPVDNRATACRCVVAGIGGTHSRPTAVAWSPRYAATASTTTATVSPTSRIRLAVRRGRPSPCRSR